MEEPRLEIATKRHARELGRSMRKADALEAWAGACLTPEQAVRASLNRSTEAYAVYYRDELLCVFGVQALDGWAAPWMLSAHAVDRYPLTFWRASKVFFGRLFDKYPRMVQMVHARYGSSLSWLRRLGFTVEPAQPWGPQDALFCRVYVERKALV